MNIDKLLELLDLYKDGQTEQRWTINGYTFENKYIRIVRIDTSNKAGGSNVNQGKQWSIIFERPTDLKLEDLKTFKDLQEKSGYIKVTQRVNYPNQYGIRIYNMSKNPDVKILGNVFDYLFD